MADLMRQRGDTAANWTSANPVLPARQIAIETDTAKLKIGDGVTAWTGLAYTGGGGAVASVFGRSGAVVAQANDYTPAQVGAAPARAVVAKTTAYTAANGDIVLCDGTGGAFAVTTPAATSGFRLTVKKVDSSVNAITITPASGTIDGATSLVLTSQYQAREIVADGTNWWIV